MSHFNQELWRNENKKESMPHVQGVRDWGKQPTENVPEESPDIGISRHYISYRKWINSLTYNFVHSSHL